MLTESEITVLLKELESARAEVKTVKSQLHALDRKKEDIFREKRKVSSDIFSRIKDAKSYKDKRNSLTDVVKTSKLSREELEARVKELEELIRKLRDEKNTILNKLKIEDPQELKRNIKKLEFKIETEALSFDKEKELMKVVSKMKKQLDGAKGVHEIDNKLDVAFRELRQLRPELDMTRKIVQVSAKESQKQHSELIESSKEIDELKTREQKFEEGIGAIKAEMHTVNELLNAKISAMEEIKKKLSENNVQFKEDAERSMQQVLREKDQVVQEKIKTGKKLTTEDLLILQRTMKN